MVDGVQDGRNEGHQDDSDKLGFVRVVDTIAKEYGWSVEYILDLTVAKLRSLVDAITVRQKNEYRSQIVVPFEWIAKVLAQASMAGGNVEAKHVEKFVSQINFPWEGDKKKVTAAEIEAAGADPNNPFWFIETGDLSAGDKNEGKSLDNFKLSN